jgi:hypothetical protein
MRRSREAVLDEVWVRISVSSWEEIVIEGAVLMEDVFDLVEMVFARKEVCLDLGGLSWDASEPVVVGCPVAGMAAVWPCY